MSLSKLTDEQENAVSHRTGHARIVAVAGAGKTATLTHYLAGRLAAGADPNRMLVLMYNRAAQQVFQTRLRRQVRHIALPRIRTFHALGLRLYQRLIQAGWLPQVALKPLAVAAVELQLRHLLQAHIRAANGEADEVQEWLPLAVELLQRYKSELGQTREALTAMAPPRGDFLVEVVEAFETWRWENRLITFDDMLYDPARVLLANPASQMLFRDRLDEILVDEYQDINPVQHFLLRILAGSRAKVMAIGDPDQTIYEFRGSSPEFITRTFAQDFPNPVTYCLSRTFRFGHALALTANHLISHNSAREPLLTVSAPDTPITRIQYTNTDDHGAKVAETISRVRESGCAYSGMAVLCRLWSYARPVELELLARGIPYRIDGEQSIFQCREVRPLCHGLELISGAFRRRPRDQQEQALFEMLATPSWKIPHALLRRISTSWVALLAAGAPVESLPSALPGDLSAHQRRALQQIALALAALAEPGREDQTGGCARQLANYAAALDYQHRLQKNAVHPTQGQEQAATVDAFLRFVAHLNIKNAADMLAFFNQMQSQQQETREDAITLTTIHRSKGLEWPVVFLPNLAEGHLPFLTGKEADPVRALEGERRLLYVALTRTQRHLFITLPDVLADPAAGVSRFFSEMRVDLSCKVGRALAEGQRHLSLDHEPGELVRRYITAVSHSLDIDVASPVEHATLQSMWRPGQQIRHSVLGAGEIQVLDEQRLHIRFADGRVRIFSRDLAAPHLTLANSPPETMQ